MAGYRESRTDRAKAAAGALAVHVVLGAAFLTGLATDLSQRRDDSLKTFDVNEPPPPVAEPPPEQGEAARDDPGEAGKKAEATPVVVPPPRIELPAESPVATAPIAGVGASPSAGAAAAGSGTGAGGTGMGRGGGGSGGAGAGQRTPAMLISGRLSRGDVRDFRALRVPSGSAEAALVINPQGRVEGCRTVRSSGVPQIDSAICGVILRSFRFSPAREADGQPIYYRINYVANWGRR